MLCKLFNQWHDSVIVALVHAIGIRLKGQCHFSQSIDTEQTVVESNILELCTSEGDFEVGMDLVLPRKRKPG